MAHRETDLSSAEFISFSLPGDEYEGGIVLMLYREANRSSEPSQNLSRDILLGSGEPGLCSASVILSCS